METRQNQGSENLQRWLEFRLGSEDYAVPLLLVREVISVPGTTPIPRSPEHFLGLMNLRGQVISIMDLRKKLRLPPLKTKSTEEAVIIVDISGIYVGVVVDAITRVIAFSNSEVSSLPKMESQLNAEFITGVHQKEKSLTILVDMGKILDIKDLSVAKSA